MVIFKWILVNQVQVLQQQRAPADFRDELKSPLKRNPMSMHVSERQPTFCKILLTQPARWTQITMPTVGKGKQFLMLFWKNWIIQKRKICCTIIEISTPIILALLLFVVRLQVDVTHKGPIVWDAFSFSNTFPNFEPGRSWLLGYTPNNSHTSGIISEAVAVLNNNPNGNLFIPKGKFLTKLNFSWNFFASGCISEPVAILWRFL